MCLDNSCYLDLSPLIQPHIVQNLYMTLSSLETKRRHFETSLSCSTEVNGGQNILFCVMQKKVRQVWNGLRLCK